MERINNLASACVRNNNGSIDVEETVHEFTNQVTTLSEVEASLRNTIGIAVNAVFDSWGDKPMTMPTLCALAVAQMSVKQEDYSVAVAAVGVYVRSNVATFNVARGKGGGVRRLPLL
jgi:hypothetical protein